MTVYAIRGTHALVTFNASGSNAINLTTGELEAPSRLDSVTVHFGAAPSTSQSLVVTKNSRLGAVYDVALLTTDPSATSATSIVYQPDAPLWLAPGDALDVTYTNTDVNQYGVEIVLERGA